jgi:hypothetical protein
MEELIMNKFEEIMNGSIQNPTQEQINEALKETVTGFKTLKDLNDFLIKLHPTDVYNIIKDYVHPTNNFVINKAKQDDVEEYKRFQDIQQEAKKVFDYESKTATIFDVKQISTNIAQVLNQRTYGILVRMISKLDDELGRVESAVNIIEEQNGLSVTKFEEENNNDTTESSNEQGSTKTPDGIGDNSITE